MMLHTLQCLLCLMHRRLFLRLFSSFAINSIILYFDLFITPHAMWSASTTMRVGQTRQRAEISIQDGQAGSVIRTNGSLWR
ncbi:hypothetical protein EDD15DRAFT_342218 [Pisolithus albus]|nr:hypothetical protein EDD15DRAFT_342218 [Pisolithus albus]